MARLSHILGISTLSRHDIFKILELADTFKRAKTHPSSLKGKTVINLFFEPSTRTRLSFETAAKRLGANSIHISGEQSSAIKGETLIDTAKTIEAMKPDILVIRHAASGAPYLLSKFLTIPVINAGDGFHEHPTQALLDLMTIQEHKKRIKGLKVLIVGDIAHSRVALSNIYGLKKMGAIPILCGPPTLIPPLVEKLGVTVYTDLKEAIRDVDVVMMLRVQTERQEHLQFPSTSEYTKYFCLNSQTLQYAKPDILIMHPGPMNRGVEITPEVADGPFSVILNQVSNGVLVRMALLHMLGKGKLYAHAH